MTVDVVVMTLRAVLVILIFYRLHQVEVYSPSLVLYVCMLAGYGLAFLGDVGRLTLSDVTLMGEWATFGSRYQVVSVNFSLIIGVSWMIWRGEDRHVKNHKKEAKIEAVKEKACSS